MENKFSYKYNAEADQKIKASIKTLENNLPPLLSLSPKERLELPKMGDKSLAFVNKAFENAKANPEFVPTYLDLVEFKKDIKAVEELHKIIRPLRGLLDMLEDTSIVAGSEAYTAALTFYSAIKGAYKAGVPKAQTIYTELQERFPGKKSSNTEKNEEQT